MSMQLVMEFVIAILVLAGVIFFIYKKKNDAKKAQEYIEQCKDDIKRILLEEANAAVLEIKNKKFNSVEDFEKWVLEQSTSRIWLMVDKYLDKAVSEKTIPVAIRKQITRERVISIINTIVTKFNISSEIRAIYCENIIKNSSDEMVEEDNRLTELFNSDDYIDDEDEVDIIIKDAHDTTEGYDEKKLVGDNDYEDIEDKEIVPALEEVDITQDESVTEEIGEDGLTESERAAGYKINKAGRKVDSKGRFVKSK